MPAELVKQARSQERKKKDCHPLEVDFSHATKRGVQAMAACW